MSTVKKEGRNKRTGNMQEDCGQEHVYERSISPYFRQDTGSLLVTCAASTKMMSPLLGIN